MGGTGADIEVEESIEGSYVMLPPSHSLPCTRRPLTPCFLIPTTRRLKTLHSKTVADSGSFWQWNGKPLEW